ncbi:MAG TPA: hypothetical protein VH186_03225 [Chloroflexia bacterium]|nr:hypothetical protein [Chloroflexia bacterium]
MKQDHDFFDMAPEHKPWVILILVVFALMMIWESFQLPWDDDTDTKTYTPTPANHTTQPAGEINNRPSIVYTTPVVITPVR